MPKKEAQKNESYLFESVLTNNEEISPGVHLISFERNFDFLPGQIIKIAVDESKKRIPIIGDIFQDWFKGV